MTYEVICVSAEETVVVLPAYGGLDFALRVFIEQDVKGNPRFHEGGLDPFGTIVDGEKGSENTGKVEREEKEKTQQKISRHALETRGKRGGRFKGYTAYDGLCSPPLNTFKTDVAQSRIPIIHLF